MHPVLGLGGGQVLTIVLTYLTYVPFAKFGNLVETVCRLNQVKLNP